MKKVLVMGATGMAGHVIALHLKETGSYDVSTLSGHSALDKDTHIVDVLEKNKLDQFLKHNNFDVVINCIGILVKQSELRKDLAVYINSYLPHLLEQYYSDKKTKVIHLSTDCVFSGDNPPYYENSTYDGQLFYDRSKSLGEIINDKDLTFRMSIIGPDLTEKGIGLFNWFMGQSGDISGFSEVIWNGITTIELAKAIDAAIKKDLSGIYNLVPNTTISKYELLKLFKEVFAKKNIRISKNIETKSRKTLVNTRQKELDFILPDYKNMIEEMKQWIKLHKDLYKHYGYSYE